MPVNPGISMSTQPIDTATGVYAAQDQQNQNAMSTEQVLKAHYDNMDDREKSRLASTVVGASHLKSFLDSDDMEGAQNFLTKRRKALQVRMANGENIDTQETDYALKALQEGRVDELKNDVNGILAAGQVYGLGDPSGENTYIQQFNDVQKAHPEWTRAQVQDYVYTRSQPTKASGYDPNTGRVVNAPGAVDASAEKAGREKYAETSSGKAGEQVIANNNTLASLDNLDYSISQAMSLLPKVKSTGPVFGRVGAASEDPDYRNLQGAINGITLQAKDLYNLGSGQGFTDADRDFLREVVAGKYARAETMEAGLKRFSEAAAHRRDFLSKQNQQYGQQYGGQQAQMPQQGGGGKVKVSNGKETLLIDAADLPHAQAEGYNPQ